MESLLGLAVVNTGISVFMTYTLLQQHNKIQNIETQVEEHAEELNRLNKAVNRFYYRTGCIRRRFSTKIIRSYN